MQTTTHLTDLVKNQQGKFQLNSIRVLVNDVKMGSLNAVL
jgi:hypothetical protein